MSARHPRVLFCTLPLLLCATSAAGLAAVLEPREVEAAKLRALVEDKNLPFEATWIKRVKGGAVSGSAMNTWIGGSWEVKRDLANKHKDHDLIFELAKEGGATRRVGLQLIAGGGDPQLHQRAAALLALDPGTDPNMKVWEKRGYATLDGRLSQGFDPVDALQRVRCPMLLLHASWWRHPSWGLVGALDEDDVARIRESVEDLRYASFEGGHEIHQTAPGWFTEQLFAFADELEAREETR